MGDHDHAAREFDQRVLQRAQRVDVEVVRRLVEQQHVAATLEQLRQVNPIAFAAREAPEELLLVGTLETEARDVGPRHDLATA